MRTLAEIKELAAEGKAKPAPKLKKSFPAKDPTAIELKRISQALVSSIEKSNQPDQAMVDIINSLLKIIKSLKDMQMKDSIITVNVPDRPSAWKFKIIRNERQQPSEVMAVAIK